MPTPFPLLPEHNPQHNTYGQLPLSGKPPHYHVAQHYHPLLTLIDFLGKPLNLLTKQKKQPSNPKKILVIRLDHLGDVIMTLPTYAALKKLYPNAELHTLVRSFSKDLFYNNKHVNKIITLDPPWFIRDKKTTWLTTFKKLITLRKEHYDLVLELHTDPRNIIAARIIGGYLVGYATRGLGFLLNKTVPSPGFTHYLTTNHTLVQAVGYQDNIPLNALTLTYPPTLSKQIKLLTNKKYILLNPCSGRPSKNWITKRWAAIGDELAKKGYTIHLTGSTADIPECETIKKHMKHPATNLAGKTSILELLALVDKATLVISPDTAIMHMSAALNTPSISLFGSTPPALCAYKHPQHSIIVKPLPCSYCALHECPRQDNPHECMTGITTQDVLAQAQKLLNVRV